MHASHLTTCREMHRIISKYRRTIKQTQAIRVAQLCWDFRKFGSTSTTVSTRPSTIGQTVETSLKGSAELNAHPKTFRQIAGLHHLVRVQNSAVERERQLFPICIDACRMQPTVIGFVGVEHQWQRVDDITSLREVRNSSTLRLVTPLKRTMSTQSAVLTRGKPKHWLSLKSMPSG